MKNKNKAAFPPIVVVRENFSLADFEPISGYVGLTKREYFAARAMQGMVQGIIKNGAVIRTESDSDALVEEAIIHVIKSGAYEIADAMLEGE